MRRMLLSAACAGASLVLSGAYDDLGNVNRDDTAFWDVSAHPQVPTTESEPFAVALDARAYGKGEDEWKSFDFDFMSSLLSDPAITIRTGKPGGIIILR